MLEKLYQIIQHFCKMNSDSRLTNFVGLSAVLTGYSSARLMPKIDPIGLAKQYLEYLQTKVSCQILNQLLMTFEKIAAQPGITPEQLDREVEQQILNDPTMGPVARRIIRLWYLGIWYNAEPPDPTKGGKVISMNAYIRGLAWDAIQAHPMGYSEMSFGYWAAPPKMPNASASQSNA
jgi:hypothetical protein